MTVRTDNRLIDAPMLPVACRACGAEVLARKSSWQQTSVQWNAEASLAARSGTPLSSCWRTAAAACSYRARNCVTRFG